jgi:hypothetical protein
MIYNKVIRAEEGIVRAGTACWDSFKDTSNQKINEMVYLQGSHEGSQKVRLQKYHNRLLVRYSRHRSPAGATSWNNVGKV